ncbi:MAG: hypothetical protein Q4E50_05550 [Tissierellia bacterium]|nr:hypothetical protein [Tissierellia bacterium]
MFLLTLEQKELDIKIGLFESVEDARKVLTTIPGYDLKVYDGHIYEMIDPKLLPKLVRLDFKGNIFFLTSFSFDKSEPIEVCWYDLKNLSQPSHGIVAGMTKVDAYMIDNEDLEDYIEKRERKFAYLKTMLEKKGYQVKRSYEGSQDGEAIIYKKEDGEWRFLIHMDPIFVNDENILEDILKLI